MLNLRDITQPLEGGYNFGFSNEAPGKVAALLRSIADDLVSGKKVLTDIHGTQHPKADDFYAESLTITFAQAVKDQYGNRVESMVGEGVTAHG